MPLTALPCALPVVTCVLRYEAWQNVINAPAAHAPPRPPVKIARQARSERQASPNRGAGPVAAGRVVSPSSLPSPMAGSGRVESPERTTPQGHSPERTGVTSDDGVSGGLSSLRRSCGGLFGAGDSSSSRGSKEEVRIFFFLCLRCCCGPRPVWVGWRCQPGSCLGWETISDDLIQELLCRSWNPTGGSLVPLQSSL